MTTSIPMPTKVNYSAPTEPSEIAIFILKEMRATGSWDNKTLNRAIEAVSSALTSSTAPAAQRRQEPEACPYAIDGCVLENQEIGPCLCALTSTPSAVTAQETPSDPDWKYNCLSALKLLHEALDVIEAIDSECLLPGQLQDMVDAVLAPRLNIAGEGVTPALSSTPNQAIEKTDGGAS